MKKRVIALVILAVLAAAVFSFADTLELGMQNKNGGNAFSAGDKASFVGENEDIVFLAGIDVIMKGSSEYFFGAGSEVSLNGQVSKDIFIAGNDLYVQGTVQRDIFAAGNKLVIESDGSRNIYAAGDDITISGTVTGNIKLNCNTLKLKDGLTVSGTITVNNDATIVNGSGSSLEKYETQNSEQQEAKTKDRIHSLVITSLFRFIGMMVIGLFLYYFTNVLTSFNDEFEEKRFGGFVKVFFSGIGVILGGLVLAIVMITTKIGILPGLVILFGFAAMFCAAPVFFCFEIGILLLRKLFAREMNMPYELAFGIFVWTVLLNVPVVKVITYILAIPFGFGSVMTLLKRAKGISDGDGSNPYNEIAMF